MLDQFTPKELVVRQSQSASGRIIFSLRDNAVWASWPNREESVHLGSYDDVAYMMRDFLAQSDLGERIAS